MLLRRRAAASNMRRQVIELDAWVWHDRGYDSEIRSGPSDDEVRAAVRALNGADRNDLYLRDTSGPWLGVGGGPDRFMVTFTAGTEGPFFQSRDMFAPPGPDIELIVGGQLISMTPELLVGRDDAIRVAVDFARSGARSAAVDWQTY